MPEAMAGVADVLTEQWQSEGDDTGEEITNYPSVSIQGWGKSVGYAADQALTPNTVNSSVERTREYLTVKEVEDLMAAARKSSRYGHRDATMILIAYRHGLRASEICDLQWHQVELNGGRPHVRRRTETVRPMSYNQMRCPGGSRWASHELTWEPGPIARSSTARKKRSARSCRCSSTAAPTKATTSRLGRMMSLMTTISLTQVTCLACAQAHLVNPKTSKVLGDDEDE